MYRFYLCRVGALGHSLSCRKRSLSDPRCVVKLEFWCGRERITVLDVYGDKISRSCGFDPFSQLKLFENFAGMML